MLQKSHHAINLTGEVCRFGGLPKATSEQRHLRERDREYDRLRDREQEQELDSGP